ncbi:MAG: hypothetical protein GY856_16845 [bacterium]|nr:hypothetical protein [bacterium]
MTPKANEQAVAGAAAQQRRKPDVPQELESVSFEPEPYEGDPDDGDPDYPIEGA